MTNLNNGLSLFLLLHWHFVKCVKLLYQETIRKKKSNDNHEMKLKEKQEAEAKINSTNATTLKDITKSSHRQNTNTWNEHKRKQTDRQTDG